MNPAHIRRVLLIRPCCIGDVVLATAALSALRDALPGAQIIWAVGGWARHAVDYHPAVNGILPTGPHALPFRHWRSSGNFMWGMIDGRFDLIVSLVRSPRMGLAVLASGVRWRAGIDSNGRGFGYNLKVPVNPAHRRHEADIYLDVVRTAFPETGDYEANLPIAAPARQSVSEKLAAYRVQKPYIVVHPGGGNNPGMRLDAKRWPPAYFASLADALADAYSVQIILIGGPDDTPLLQAVNEALRHPVAYQSTRLTFAEIGALAAAAVLYVGNDSGLTHLAAASGAATAMIFGPSDPARYGPYTRNSIALWKPTELASGGVAAAHAQRWDWTNDGIQPADALEQLHAFLS